jgi:lipoprotein-anchoring transpeptidase ErfK/SrfK
MSIDRGYNPTHFLDISIARQQLVQVIDGNVVRRYTVSTAKNGAGELKGSECTPTGWHKIRAKIGGDQPVNSVFVSRRSTGEIYSPELALKFPLRDWILTRILWLNGLEPGKNRYGCVDSGWRFIYIHGCPDACEMGVPASHGCIRMQNADLLDLFARVELGLPVYIHE